MTTQQRRKKNIGSSTIYNATRVYVNQRTGRDILLSKSNVNSKHNGIIKAVIVSDYCQAN